MSAEHGKQIVDQFTRQAEPYSAAAAIRKEEALRRIVAIANAGPEDTVLDVASGPGLLACAFAPAVRRVTGIDLTPAMLQQARCLQQAKAAENLDWVRGEAPPLPFRRGAFSIVTCRYAFHHLLDPFAVLAEMHRVCAPGGRVLVSDVTPDAAHAAAFNHAEKMRDPSHVQAYPAEEFVHWFERAGLAGIRTHPDCVEGNLEDLLGRSFPQPGDADRLRRLYRESLADDHLGIGARREGDDIAFRFPVTVIAALVP